MEMDFLEGRLSSIPQSASHWTLRGISTYASGEKTKFAGLSSGRPTRAAERFSSTLGYSEGMKVYSPLSLEGLR